MSESEYNKSNKAETDWKESVEAVSELSTDKIQSDLSDVSKLQNVAQFHKIETYEFQTESSRSQFPKVYQDNYTEDNQLSQNSMSNSKPDNSNKNCKRVLLNILNY